MGGAVWVAVKHEWFPLLHPNWTVVVGWLVLCVLLWMGRNATLLYIVLATSRKSFTKDVDVRGTIERASNPSRYAFTSWFDALLVYYLISTHCKHV